MRKVAAAFVAGVVVLAGTQVGVANADSHVELESAAGSMASIRLRISAECVDGDAYFKVTNVGAGWPKAGSFSIYRTIGNTMISQRRMRMDEGQTASFRVKSAASSGHELALAIEPGWYDRNQVYDATVKCE